MRKMGTLPHYLYTTNLNEVAHQTAPYSAVTEASRDDLTSFSTSSEAIANASSPALRTTFSTIDTTHEIALPINENAVETCDEYDE